MPPSPWWFTPLMTLLGIAVGGAVSIVTAWLTQRYSLQAQLAIKRADAEAAAKAALKAEKEKRYLAIVFNIVALYTSANAMGRRNS